MVNKKERFNIDSSYLSTCSQYYPDNFLIDFGGNMRFTKSLSSLVTVVALALGTGAYKNK